MIKLAWRMGNGLEKIGKQQIAAVRKATVTAIQVESFRLRKEAQAAIRKGDLGLRQTTPLRKKEGRTTRRRPRAPLKNFSKGVLYKMDKTNITAQVGFIGTTPSTEWQAKTAEKSIPGYRILYTEAMRDHLHEQGIHVRDDTVSAAVPARDIIGEFMKKQTESRIMSNIETNIARKLRGERI